MALEDIVNVQITTQATSPSRANFGTPLAAGFHTVFPERVRIYRSTDDMVSDGFGSTDPLVRLVGVILSQNPKVTEVLVGRMANAPVRTIKVTPIQAGLDLNASSNVSIVVNGQAVTIALDATPTIAEATAALKIAIDALALTGVTTVDNTTDLDIVGSAGNEVFVELDRTIFARKDNTVDPNDSGGGPGGGTVEDIINISLENDGWYTLLLAQDSQAIAEAAAAYIESRFRTFHTVTGDDDALDALSTTDLLSSLAASNLARTAPYYHPNPHEYLNGASSGKELPLTPGSYTMKFQQLRNVSQVRMSDTEKNTVRTKRGNTFTETAGLTFLEEGVMSAAGEFIDVPRFIDFLRNDMQVSILADLVNLDKIPITNNGFAIVEAQIRAALTRGIASGGLAADPEPTVTVPRAEDVPQIDRAARNITGFEFTAQLAGAIHNLTIQGTVTA